MKKKKIEFAAADRVGYLQPWVDQVMEVVFPDYMFISDQSAIDHFPIEEKDLPRISKELGVPVKLSDLIVDVAQRMKNAFG